jgi:hypothetical protein
MPYDPIEYAVNRYLWQPTWLPPQQENRFGDFYSKLAQQHGLNENPDDSEHYYDYRGAWAAGGQPDATQDFHWSSLFKAPGHPRETINGVNTVTGRTELGGIWDPSQNMEPYRQNWWDVFIPKTQKWPTGGK